MGGKENVDKQHSQGKMTVRECIDMLLDKESFLERGVLTGVATYDRQDKNKLVDLAPCPFIMGVGRINCRRVAVQC